jgi:catalase
MRVFTRRNATVLALALLAIGAHAAKSHKSHKPAKDAVAVDNAAVAPQALLEDLHALSGDHPGYRPMYAKGVLLTGTFEPTIQAALMSRAKHFHFPSVVTVRFSDSTGLPDIADGNPNAGPHGLAVRFQMPDGSGFTDIVAHSYNGFPVRTGAEFGSFVRALATSPDANDKKSPLAKFLASHPAAKRYVSSPKLVPDSFEGETFYGVNTFILRDDHNRTTAGRYVLLPNVKGHILSSDEAAAKPANFLADEMRDRIKREAIEFDLMFQLPAKGDKLDDATIAWPDNRQQVRLGTLYLTQAAPDAATTDKQLAMNPLNLIDGVEVSDDPLLKVRGSTYALSAAARGASAAK